MDCDKFFNLLATILGTLGTFFVMQSILEMSPELMLRQAQSHWDLSVPQIEALAGQKADNVAGFVFVLIAFAVASLTIAFVPEGKRLFQSKCRALVAAFVFAGALYIALHFVSQGLSRCYKLAVGKIVTSEYLDKVISRGRLEVADSTQIADHAREYLELKVLPGESTRSLTQRVASEVGKALPQNLDYSAVEPKR